MIVVFDSNIWYSQLGLKSAPAAAVRFFLRQHGARVAIPEVVRLEVTHNLTRRLLEHIDRIRVEYRQLLTAFGTLREVVLPTEADVRARIDELLGSLGVEEINVPFTLESARSSFLKTIHKTPPSQGKQQFKDGVLWADCLKLAEQDEVVLVTEDKAFFKDQQPAKGLADELIQEAGNLASRIRVVPELSALLDAIKQPIRIEPDSLLQAFLEAHRESVLRTLQSQGFTMGELSSSSLKIFATEDSARLFFEFSLEIACRDMVEERRADATLILKGDGSYLPGASRFEELRNFGEHLRWLLPDGSMAEIRNSVIFANSIVIGHREVTGVTRFPLSQ
jgi:hypothetical protein